MLWCHTKPEELHSILPTWPFDMWGIEILGPFPMARGKVKFLLVAVGYFTKWIKAEPLVKITASQVQKFGWKNISMQVWDSGCDHLGQWQTIHGQGVY